LPDHADLLKKKLSLSGIGQRDEHLKKNHIQVKAKKNPAPGESGISADRFNQPHYAQGRLAKVEAETILAGFYLPG